VKAIRIGSPAALNSLAILEVDDPGQPQSGEVRVAVRACSLNYRDTAIAAGELPSEPGRTPLADASGTVVSVGEGIESLAVGDHVISRFFPTWDAGDPFLSDFSATPGDGLEGFGAEFVVRPAHHFTRAPKGLTHEQASTLPVAAVTAWRALASLSGLKAGDTVLVLGSGGVSIIALQLALSMGARVIATTSSDQKGERLRAIGASDVVNYKTTPEWGKAVLALTEGRGVDHIIEVGGSGTLQQSIEAVRVGGNILMLGILAGFGGNISTFPLTMKQIHLSGIVVGSLQDQQQVVRAIEVNNIVPVVDRVFPVAQVRDAFRFLAEGKHFGKVVITF